MDCVHMFWSINLGIALWHLWTHVQIVHKYYVNTMILGKCKYSHLSQSKASFFLFQLCEKIIMLLYVKWIILYCVMNVVINTCTDHLIVLKWKLCLTLADLYFERLECCLKVNASKPEIIFVLSHVLAEESVVNM